jgi:formylglycine-generating enzyme required for sulfatase activity
MAPVRDRNDDDELDDESETLPGGPPPTGPGRPGVPAKSPRPEDEQTLASAPDPSAAGGGGAEDGPDSREAPTGDVEPFDLESLPPRPKTPGGGTTRPPSTGPGATVVSPPEATVPPTVAMPSAEGAEPPTSEARTSDIQDIRAILTQAGAQAGTTAGAGGPEETVPDDERATIADPGAAAQTEARGGGARESPSGRDVDTHAPTAGLTAAGSATQRSQGPVPASKFSRGTARDPVVGTAAGRGTQPGARPALTALQPGMLLADRYELVKRLGKGGMGEVWQAKHTLLQGMRAIKVIKASISRDPSFRARFLSEGQTMMRVKDDYVVEVTDLDETRQNRELFMVMEHLQGRTMYDAIRDAKAPLHLDLRQSVRIFRELALGIQRIHDERIVHKDLKTDNVILVKSAEDGLDHPKVIDFGLAKRMGETGGDVAPEQGVGATYGSPDPDLHTTLSGTLAYMSPEQFRGEPSSFQSDIYAYGVMLYECFTDGEYPMPRGTLAEYVQRHRESSVPRRLRQARPDLDPYVAELADRCMAPRREDRPVSMAEVAGELKWWLDAPERAARRKKWMAIGGAFAAVLAFAAWAILFKKQAAGVTNLSIARAGGGEPLESRAGRTYLSPTDLGAVAFEGIVTGEAETPSLLVDGEPHEADLRFESRDGKKLLTGSSDLRDLAEGAHTLGFRASPVAEAAEMRVVVDRQPPEVLAVEMAGARGIHTRAETPVLTIRLGEPRSELRRVYARVAATGRDVEAQASESDPNVWTVQGVHSGDGEQTVAIRADDLAGNSTPQPFPFRFVRDVQAPKLDVKDVLEDRLQVRDPAGNRFAVTCAEDAELKVSFLRQGETVPTERTFAAAKTFEVPLPDVSTAGTAVTLVATDAAGNTTERRFDARLVTDEASLLSETGARVVAVRGGEDVKLRVHRSYQLPAEFSVVRTQVRTADGATAQDAAQQTLSSALREIDAARPTDATVRFTANFPPGEYALRLEGLAGAATAPLTLVVDPAPPKFASVTVKDAEGRVVAPGAWCLSDEVTVEVEMEELAPASISLEGIAPEQPATPGRSRSVFQRKLTTQGTNTLNLAARDQSGNDAAPTTVVVLADWTPPSLELTSPRPGDTADNVTEVVFAGRCSEERWTLVVQGLPDAPRKADHTQAAFADKWTLPKGEHTLVVSAVDPAGRTSAPIAVPLHVEYRAVVKRPQVQWTTGVTAEMRRIDPGDVLIGRAMQPVAQVYLDLTEVTNAQYREFLKACEAHKGARTPWDHPDQPAKWSHTPPAETWNDPKWNGDLLPVVNVAWWDAYAFAKWSGRRLPAEAEWVKAAAKAEGERGLRSWPPIAEGEPWKDGLLATAESTKQTGPVDATKGGDESPSKCLHMGGNVSEWVDLPFAREGDAKSGVRGGSFLFSRFGADIARVPTKPYDRSFRARTIGFRCAVDAEQVAP